MELKILGTGNAQAVNCYNTCFALADKEEYFLVDAGGGNGILKVLDLADIPMEQIHHIFVTHEHVDHILGLIWLIRFIGTKMNQGKYEGNLYLYSHKELETVIRTIAGLTIQKKVCKWFDDRIIFVPVKHGEKKQILSMDIQFFDIGSTKAKQYGFTMRTARGTKLTCTGDEPYQEDNYEFVKESDWLLHEAFCLYEERERFKPYEKHHTTVKEACELAEQLQIPNLVLYHTEDKQLDNRKARYTAEGRQFYRGRLFVPEDLECFTID